jgi:hypothetical protein
LNQPGDGIGIQAGDYPQHDHFRLDRRQGGQHGDDRSRTELLYRHICGSRAQRQPRKGHLVKSDGRVP